MDKSHPKSVISKGFIWFHPNDQLVISKIFSNHFFLLIFTVEDTRVRILWMLDIVSVRTKIVTLSANQTWHWKKNTRIHKILFGGLEHGCYDFPIILGHVMIPTDFHIFFRRVAKNYQFQ